MIHRELGDTFIISEAWGGHAEADGERATRHHHSRRPACREGFYVALRRVDRYIEGKERHLQEGEYPVNCLRSLVFGYLSRPFRFACFV